MKCEICGEEFSHKRWNQKTCSKKCSRALQTIRDVVTKHSKNEERLKKIREERRKWREQNYIKARQLSHEWSKKKSEEMKAIQRGLEQIDPDELLKMVKEQMEVEKKKCKFTSWMLNPTKGYPVRFIVGERPGERPAHMIKSKCWTVTRSGELMSKGLAGLNNVWMTNIILNETRTQDGIKRLQKEADKHKPTMIICLGKFAAKHVKKIKTGAEIIEMHHPSYMRRFKPDKITEYLYKIRGLLSKAV